MTLERLDLSAFGEEDAGLLGCRLERARLVCFPTDTVYGVGGALRPAVGAALVAAKRRDPAKPLQVIFPNVAVLERLVAMPAELRVACRRLLPGPVTLVVPGPPGWSFPPLAPGGTLGMRVPAWPPSARCLAALDVPLVASSANPSGAPPPATLDAVDPELLEACDLALDAGPVGGAVSSVVDLCGYARGGDWRLLRAGAWSEDEIADRLGGGEGGLVTS